MQLYSRYVRILFRSQTEYRASFLLLCLAQLMIPFFALAGIWAMFARFGTLAGWTMPEALMCYGVIHVAFSLAECFSRGFDAFSGIVRLGEFDRILVRPRGTILQVLGTRFEFNRVGRLFQGLCVLLWSSFHAGIHWTAFKVLTLLFMCIGGVAIFTGIFMLSATWCFWTVEGTEIANIFTDGGREVAQYPLSIYPGGFMRFFTFVIPFGCINYIPLLHLLDRPGYAHPLLGFVPLAGFLFLIPCIGVWQWGVRHYQSTGS